jgi:hypothetical protein
MCVGDYRLSQFVNAIPKRKLLGIGGTLDIPRNPNRVGIGFYIGDVVMSVLIQMEQEGVLTNFYTLTGINQSLEFFMVRHGDIVQRSWRLTGQDVTATPLVVEWELPEEVLRANLSMFMKG